MEDHTLFADTSREPLLAPILARVAELTGITPHNDAGYDFVLRAVRRARACPSISYDMYRSVSLHVEGVAGAV